MNKKNLIAQISQNIAAPESQIPPDPVKPNVPVERKKETNSPPKTKSPVTKSPTASKTEKNSASGSGKQTALWLDDEDRAILHEMGMLLYSQGIKPSHNVVIRAAIRLMPKDHRFFEKVQELASQDGRKIRHHK